MPFKARTESVLLKILRILNTRGDLTEDEQKYYSYQEKGYEGEVQFDALTEQLQLNCYILNDLLLEVNNSQSQIDTTIITQRTLYLFDVKNFEGDFCYDGEKFLSASGKERKNPLIQLKRSQSLVRQLIQDLGYNLHVEAYVIFINPEFTLYLAPLDLPFIFPTQLKRFLKKLDEKPSRLNNIHKKLADKLVSLHQTESYFKQVPHYDYLGIKKGITCKVCRSFSVSVKGKFVVCGECGFEELVGDAVLRCVGEFKLLFPELKITTAAVHEWCKIVESKKRISRILESKYKISGVHQWSFYE
jgi:hypothetical protein